MTGQATASAKGQGMGAETRLPNEAERHPIVTVKDGEVFANSRDVAEYFGKEHRSVLRDIDNLVAAEPELGLHNFVQGSYTLPATGSQAHRCFDMNRDGFTLLAMGFTGTKALKWKIQFLGAFNAMEAQLRDEAFKAAQAPIALPAVMTDHDKRIQRKADALEVADAEIAENCESCSSLILTGDWHGFFLRRERMRHTTSYP